MKNSTWIRIDEIGIVVGFTIMIISLTGEIAGWWNDAGTVGGLVGLAVSIYGAMDRNGRLLLERFTAQEEHSEAMLGK